jgi:transaldolase
MSIGEKRIGTGAATATNATRPGFFHRLSSAGATRFWINNPTLAEAKEALAAGAVCATTNPTYVARLLREEPDHIAGLIAEVSKETSDAGEIADRVCQKAVARLQQLFLPLFEQSNGQYGYVAIQGDPRVNSDPDAILQSAIRHRELGENIIIKVPSWPAGREALEKLVELGFPTIATLGFSVDQAIYMAEAHRRALRRSGKRPICYVTFIAGVLDTYLAEISAQRGQLVSPDALRHAGSEASRAAYRIYKSRGYEAVLLGGGARAPHHFTELVGGDLAITIGWNLAQQLIEADAPIVSRIDAELPTSMISELESNLPEFRNSYREHSLQPEDFHDFGPVASFQASFLAGIECVLKSIDAQRSPALRGKVER